MASSVYLPGGGAPDPWVAETQFVAGDFPAPHFSHGMFWSASAESTGVAIGSMWWSALMRISPDMLQSGLGYLVSDGAGGAHALLWGFGILADNLSFGMTGNVWPRADASGSAFSYSSQSSDAIMPGEWGYPAIGYDHADNAFLWEYWNGVPIGVQNGLTQRYSYPGGGAGVLFVGGSNHQHLAAKYAWLTGWDTNKWANSDPFSAGEAYIPSVTLQTIRPDANSNLIPADFIADYTVPGNIVPDASWGLQGVASNTADYRGSPSHPGQFEFPSVQLAPQIYGRAIKPRRILDSTCPLYRPGPIVGARVSAPQTTPTDQTYRVFDDFSNRRSCFADTLFYIDTGPSMGSTTSGTLGPLSWNTRPFLFSDPNNWYNWGVIFGYATYMGRSIAPAWVDSGVANGGTQFRAPTTCLAGRKSFIQDGPGLVFRFTDIDNYHAVLVLGNNTAIYRKREAAVNTDSDPFNLTTGWTSIRATYSGTAINVYESTTALTTPNPVFGSSLFNTTSSFNQSATEVGLLAGSGLARFSSFASY